MIGASNPRIGCNMRKHRNQAVQTSGAKMQHTRGNHAIMSCEQMIDIGNAHDISQARAQSKVIVSSEAWVIGRTWK